MIRSAVKPGFRLECNACHAKGPFAEKDTEAGIAAQEAGWQVASVWTNPRHVGKDFCPVCLAKRVPEAVACGAVK